MKPTIVINLSSYPSKEISGSMALMKAIGGSGNIKIHPITPPQVLVSWNKTLYATQRGTIVVIVDTDDEDAKIKVKNINKIYVRATIQIVIIPMIQVTALSQPTLVRRVVTDHATKEQQQKTASSNTKVLSRSQECTVAYTYILGPMYPGTAGIRVYCAECGSIYEQIGILKDSSTMSWLLSNGKSFSIIGPPDEVANDYHVNDDNEWMYKSSLTNYMQTIYGPREFMREDLIIPDLKNKNIFTDYDSHNKYTWTDAINEVKISINNAIGRIMHNITYKTQILQPVWHMLQYANMLYEKMSAGLNKIRPGRHHIVNLQHQNWQSNEAVGLTSAMSVGLQLGFTMTKIGMMLAKWVIKNPISKVEQSLGTNILRKANHKMAVSLTNKLTKLNNSAAAKYALYVEKKDINDARALVGHVVETNRMNMRTIMMISHACLGALSNMMIFDISFAIAQIIVCVIGELLDQQDIAMMLIELMSPVGFVYKIMQIILITVKRIAFHNGYELPEVLDAMLTIPISLMMFKTPDNDEYIDNLQHDFNTNKSNIDPTTWFVYDHTELAKAIQPLIPMTDKYGNVLDNIIIINVAILMYVLYDRALSMGAIQSIVLAILTSSFVRKYIAGATVSESEDAIGTAYVKLNFGLLATMLRWIEPTKDKKMASILEAMSMVFPNIGRYRSWEHNTKNIIKGNDKAIISQYWIDKGLDVEDVNFASINMAHPNKERIGQGKALVLSNHFDAPDTYKEIQKKFGPADQSDEMHVKSLKKRLLSKRHSPSLKTLITFTFTMIKHFAFIRTEEVSTVQGVRKALITKGTAGEFSKGTILESEWKNVNNVNLLASWLMAVPKVITAIGEKLPIPDRYKTYMVYRKVEILPKDENGEMKVTRIMQAPNLVLRVADSVVFSDLNNALGEMRFKDVIQIGINIITELPLFLDMNEMYVYLSSDFSNYDSTGHPGQMEANKLTRCINKIYNHGTNRRTVSEIKYLNKRYDIQIERKIDSLWGLSGIIVGQQASGDITTSDDNSMRSATYTDMVFDEQDIKRDQKDADAMTSGDDIIFKLFGVNIESFKHTMVNVSKKLGWVMPLIEQQQFGTNAKPEFLGHTTCLVEFVLPNDNAYLRIIVTTREQERMIGKMMMNANLEDELTSHAKMIQTAKCLSYINMLWPRSDVFLYNIYLLIKMSTEALADISDLPYVWQQMGIPITANMNQIMYNTTGLEFNNDVIIKEVFNIHTIQVINIIMKDPITRRLTSIITDKKDGTQTINYTQAMRIAQDISHDIMESRPEMLKRKRHGQKKFWNWTINEEVSISKTESRPCSHKTQIKDVTAYGNTKIICHDCKSKLDENQRMTRQQKRYAIISDNDMILQQHNEEQIIIEGIKEETYKVASH